MKQQLDIIYKDDYILCLNKPSGLLVHSAKYMKNDDDTLVGLLLKEFPQIANVGDDTKYRPGIIHRLDKETSGIILVALTQDAFVYFKSLFANRKIKKIYKAIVCGEVKEKKWTIDRAIGIKSGTTKRTVFSDKHSKIAVTEFVREEIFELNGEKYTLINAMPKTGRTHQIRVHLNSINHPIIGDPLYGGKTNRNKAERLMLHAFSIEFVHIDDKVLYFEANLPEDFVNFINFVK